MFGYVTADKPEMRVRDFYTFRSYYCGVCREIGHLYGELPRFMLTYDCAFLYLLLASVAGEKEEYGKKICPASPLTKKPYAKDAFCEYAASMNVLLGVGNLRDKKKDKSWAGGLAAGTLSGAYKKARSVYPAVAEAMEKGVRALQQMEDAGETDIDQVSDAFACLLGEVFAGAGVQSRILYELGYHIGRWIYLIDALDDLERDKKKGAYNPFLRKFGDDAEAIKKSAAFNLNSSLQGAILAYDLLDIKKHKEILDNILYSGLAKKTEQVLRGDKEKVKNGSI